jgi:hypothetical protein
MMHGGVFAESGYAKHETHLRWRGMHNKAKSRRLPATSAVIVELHYTAELYLPLVEQLRYWIWPFSY